MKPAFELKSSEELDALFFFEHSSKKNATGDTYRLAIDLVI